VGWWKHGSKAGQHSSAKVHGSLRNLLKNDGQFDQAALKASLEGLEPEIIDGF
jgi:CRISPR-associated protein Csd2